MKRLVYILVTISLMVGLVGVISCGGETVTPPSGGTTPPPEEIVVEVTAQELYSDYEANEVAADQKYEDKILQVDGVIISIGKDITDTPYVVLGKGEDFELGGVQCFFNDEDVVAQLSKGQIATVKGKCTGYLWNVLVEDCSLESISEPPPIDLSASFTVTDWKQDYYEFSEEWSDYVYVYYEVENTGDVDIDYYEVYFVVLCQGGSYHDWTNGMNVRVGAKLSGSTIINVAGKRVRNVEVEDWNLTAY